MLSDNLEEDEFVEQSDIHIKEDEGSDDETRNEEGGNISKIEEEKIQS